MDRTDRSPSCHIRGRALHLVALATSLSFSGAAARAQPTLPAVTRADDPGRSMVVDLPLDGGHRQRALFLAPPNARAAIVMLPGGSGRIGLEADGMIRQDHDFVVRTRAAWLAKGYALLIPDAVDDRNERGLRSTPRSAAVVATDVAFFRAKIAGPIFLLGTSQGAIAAMNGAAHAAPWSIAGVILSESVTRIGGSGETVFDADPQAVTAPVLIVANAQDACRVAPPQDAPRIRTALSGSRDVQVLTVSGGTDAGGEPCGSLSPHGYLGIEDQVVDGIDRWMRAHG